MRLLFLIITFAFVLAARGQVDVTKYASEDLFDVKPLIDVETINQPKKEAKKSQWEAEIQKGLDYWNQQEYDEAQFYFEQMQEEYPQTLIFPYYLGMINYERNRFDESLRHLNEVLRIDPLFLEAKYMTGVIFLEQNNDKQAISIFKELKKLPKYSAYGEHGLALYSLKRLDAYRTRLHLKKCLEKDASFLEAYIPLISTEIYFGKIKSARNYIEQALVIAPTWEEGIMVRAMISLLQDENLEQFETDINTLLKLDPSNYHYNSIKAFLKMELGQYNDAVKQFKVVYDSSVDTLRRGKHSFSSKFKKEESVQRSLTYYFDNYSMDASAREHLDKGICLLIADEKEEAIAQFDSALIYEQHPAIYNFIGATQKSLFSIHTNTLTETYTNAIKLDSLNWIAYSYRGESYLSQNALNEAYEDYSMVIALKPRQKEGYKNRGNILTASGKYRQAYQDYSRAIALDTTDTDLFFNRAKIAYLMNYIDHAQSDLDNILKSNPKDGEAYYIKYQCKLTLGDTMQAIYLLDSASKFEKHNQNYHNELLTRASEADLYEYALNAHNRLVKYYSYQYRHLLNRGEFYYNNAKYDLAIKDLENLIKKDKTSGKGHYYLGKCYELQGDLKQSSKHLKKAKKFGYSPQ